MAGTPFAKQLAPFKSTLAARLRTRFERQMGTLRGPSGAEIELAVDQSYIMAGKYGHPQQALCELALGLKSGPVADLFTIALAAVANCRAQWQANQLGA